MSCSLLLAFLVWSLLVDIKLFSVAPGEVQSSEGKQVVESQVSGSVAAIYVKDGDHVRKGDRLVDLDKTFAVADRSIIQSKIANLRGEVVRRETAASAVRADPIRVDAEIAWGADFTTDIRHREEEVLRADLSQISAKLADLASQRSVKLAAKAQYTAGVVAEKALITARAERTSMREQLADKGWDSRSKVLDALEPLRSEQVTLATLEGSLNEVVMAIPVLDSKMIEARESFTSINTQKAAEAERLIDDLNEQLIKADQAVADMSLVSPITGVVHALALTSLGQAVRPGQQMMQIVPDGAAIRVTAYVLNADIGFVRKGQRATIKVDAFPFTRYGTIEGRVESVAADAIPGDLALEQQLNGSQPETHGPLSATAPAQQTSDLVFPITIVPAKDSIMIDDRSAALLPGMSAVVEIETEQQRMMNYILYPLARAIPHRSP